MTNFQTNRAERNARWKRAVSIIVKNNCDNPKIWQRVRRWYDGVAGNDHIYSIEAIVKRYMNELLADVMADVEIQAGRRESRWEQS